MLKISLRILANLTVISNNIKCIRSEIGPKVELVAVTKNRTATQIEESIQAGITIIGENRIQEAASKFPKLSSPVTKHFIGHLQTNKVKLAVELFDLIQSVDSLRLAQKINQEATRQQKTMPILLEVNIAKDPKKYGFTPDETSSLLPEIQALSNIEVRGLMTIVPYFEDPEQTRSFFKQIKTLQTKLALPELSMGMSNDYHIAVQEGATIVRIGSAIFN
jgi:PLP dependent protein